MTSRSTIHAVLLFTVASLVDIQPVSGQRQVARYQPRRSTVSPYNNLTRFNAGGLPNYFAFVRPQLQQQSFNTRSETAIDRQSTSLRDLRSDLQLTQRAIVRGEQTISPTGKGSWFMQQGTRSVFGDDTRFYPQFQRARR